MAVGVPAGIPPRQGGRDWSCKPARRRWWMSTCSPATRIPIPSAIPWKSLTLSPAKRYTRWLALQQGRGRRRRGRRVPVHYLLGHTQGSAVLKIFDMTVATTGVNERRQGSRSGYDKVYAFSNSHASLAAPECPSRPCTKRAPDALGAQIVGFDGVDERCDVLATAIVYRYDCQRIHRAGSCYAPPFGSAEVPR